MLNLYFIKLGMVLIFAYLEVFIDATGSERHSCESSSAPSASVAYH